jgi:transposase
VPALPSSILEPLWVQVSALLPTRQVHHPLGCHRRRIPDRIVFDKLIQVLVFGCGYRRIADATCSATTLRRRRDEWIAQGLAEQLHLAVLGAYKRLFGLELEHLTVDGCSTKAPCGGQVAGPSPVDRRKQGLKRSVATEAAGIPLAAVPAPANRRQRRAAGRHLGRRRAARPAGAAAHRASGRRLQLAALPGGPGRSGHGGRDRHPWSASPDPSRSPVGDRADPWLDQPVRQAALVHRTPPAGSSSSGWPWSTPSSSVAGSSAAPGPTIAGTVDPAAAHDHLLAQALSGVFAGRAGSPQIVSSVCTGVSSLE